MNRAQHQRIEEIVYLWLIYVDKNDKIDSITNSGLGVLEKFTKAQSSGGGFKPDSLSGKVDKERKIVIWPEEKQARDTLMSIPIHARPYLTEWPQIKNKKNPATKKRFTLEECAGRLGVTLERFKTVRDMAGRLLLLIDQAKNPEIYERNHRLTDSLK